MMNQEVGSGGEPETFAKCTSCGSIYPAQSSDDGLRPVGTDGACNCGNTDFQAPDPDDFP